MASRYDHWLKLEKKRVGDPIELTGEQVAFIGEQNPAFWERHMESSLPGELLRQDTSYVGRLKGVGRAHLHVVADMYLSYAFGFLHTSKHPGAVVAVLHNDMLPFRQRRAPGHGHPHGQRLGVPQHGEPPLAVPGVERNRAPQDAGQKQRTNLVVERFNETVLDEFFQEAFRAILYETVEALQENPDAGCATTT